MATIVMDMNGYGIERAVSLPEEYEKEILHPDWNPALAISMPEKKDRNNLAEAGLVDVDVDAFLEKMVRFQR